MDVSLFRLAILCILNLGYFGECLRDTQLGDPCSRTDGTDIGEPFVQYLNEQGVAKTKPLREVDAGESRKRAATAHRSLLWPNATVVYTIGSEYTVTESEIILDAMREWEDKTCVRFKRRSKETSYLHFYKGFGCCSFVGNLNYGRQPISLPNNCLHHAIVLHEIGHAIGFWHEQSRPDRDKYVTVLFQNVKLGYSTNFNRKDASEVNSLGVTYDFNSIMHYHRSAFSRYAGADTMKSKEPGIPLGNALELSRLDVLQTNRLYRCGEEFRPKLTPPKNVTKSSQSNATVTPSPNANSSSCSHRLAGLSGSFASPGYPNGYKALEHCTWRITVPKGFYLSFLFQPISLSFADLCDDYIEIHDGPGLSSPVMRRTCGYFARFLQRTTSNGALVVFHSDSHTAHQDLGFQAFYIAVDIDECASPEVCDHNCINTPGSYICGCKNGYYISPNRKFCHDINECGVENGHCSHTCVNTAGSYFCRCPSLFRLSSDLRTCLPYLLPSRFNLCTRNNGGCEQLCSLAGTLPDFSVICRCRFGYKLAENRKNCSDLNECDNIRDTCSPGHCVNTLGSYHCACPAGYTSPSAQTGCIDVNECKSDNGGCAHTCQNTYGSFHCTCRGGFRLDRDGTNCTDINECNEDMHSCSQICINLLGSYRCACETGYSLTKGTCEDVDECKTTSSSHCEHICVNSIGSYSCECHLGYQMDEDGHSCIDINECETDSGGCDDICINTEGSYYCQCSPGLYLASDQHSCEVNGSYSQCILGHHGCQPVCNSSVCRCAIGFRLSLSGKLCIDIDECVNNGNVCSQYCTNLMGSFNCSCYSGYTLMSDLYSCAPRSCDLLNGECEHECFTDVLNNTRCRCMPGFVISTAERACQQRPSGSEVSVCHLPCSHGCRVFDKVYACQCNPGYQLASDKITCLDIDECTYQNGGCSQECNNTNGAYRCICSEGYVLGADLRSCEDVNECLLSNPCHWRCINTKGSYKCLCPRGFRLVETNGKCIPNCGGFYASSSGSLSTPWYPLYYSQGLDCWWFVTVPNAFAVDVFLNIDVDETQGCIGDVVEVLNGGKWDSPSMGRMCGSRQVSLTSSTSNIIVRFKSDNNQSRLRKRGLYFTFKIGSPMGHFSCGGVNILRGNTYTFGNAKFPSYITSPQDCSWIMINLQHPSRKAAIDFLYYDIDSQGNCSDYLVVGERRNDEDSFKICSPNDAKKVVVSARAFGIWLHVDTANRFRGFHARITSVI